jgi:ribosomal protein S6
MQKKGDKEADELALLPALDDTEADDEPLLSVYEIGYHVLPTLSEEGALQAASALAELLTKNGAEAVGDHAPTRTPLAYTITKRIGGKVLRFDEAYFGWVAFEMPRGALARVKEALDANPSILRYLIITTSRDAVAASLAGNTITLQTVRPTGNIEKPKREAEGGGEMSEAALDEALQTIATEDAKVAE